MSTKLTDNGTLITLGLVGAVAAVGAANQAGFYGPSSGSAARGDVTATYVDTYLDGDNIAISSFLNRHLRGKAKQYAGSYARRMKAALEAMVASGEAIRDTTPNGAASYRRADHAPSGSAARGLRSTAFSVVRANAEESKGMYHPPVVIKVGTDRIVTGAGTNDDLALFRYGDNLLLVVMNERMPYYGATLYTHDGGAWHVDQDVFLQGSEEVEDALGPKWDRLQPATVANRLLAVMS